MLSSAGMSLILRGTGYGAKLFLKDTINDQFYLHHVCEKKSELLCNFIKKLEDWRHLGIN